MRQPALSVVIASHNPGAVITRALASLCAQRGDGPIEIIVADSSSDDTATLVRAFPAVRLLAFAEALTVPELRGRAIAEALGAVIAILDPFSIVDEGWAAALLQAHARWPHPVIGGAVEIEDPGGAGLVAWALYINEYGLFMPPVRAGAHTIVPGCNVSYKRRALFDGDRPRYDVFWKTFVNDEIEAAGAPLWMAPEILIRLSKPIPFTEFLASRFDHGRCFAGMRAAGWSGGKRLVYAGGTTVLPFLQLWRWSRVFWAKRRHRGRLLLSLPLQVLLFGVWAAGEAAGYVRGAGTSCRRLFY